MLTTTNKPRFADRICTSHSILETVSKSESFKVVEFLSADFEKDGFTSIEYFNRKKMLYQTRYFHFTDILILENCLKRIVENIKRIDGIRSTPFRDFINEFYSKKMQKIRCVREKFSKSFLVVYPCYQYKGRQKDLWKYLQNESLFYRKNGILEGCDDKYLELILMIFARDIGYSLDNVRGD